MAVPRKARSTVPSVDGGGTSEKAPPRGNTTGPQSGQPRRQVRGKLPGSHPGTARLSWARALRNPEAAEALMRLGYNAEELAADLSLFNNDMERRLGVALRVKAPGGLGDDGAPTQPTFLPLSALWAQVVSNCAALAPMTEGLSRYIDALADNPEDLRTYLTSEKNELAVAAIYFLAQLTGYLRECDRLLACLSVWRPGNPAYEILMVMRYVKIESRTEEHLDQCQAALERLAGGYFKNPVSRQAWAAQRARLHAELSERAVSCKRSRDEELKAVTKPALFTVISSLGSDLTTDQQIQVVQRGLEPIVMDDLLGPAWRMRFRNGREIPIEEETTSHRSSEVSDALTHAAFQQEAHSPQRRLEDESEYKNLVRIAACAGVSEENLELLMAQGDHHGGLKEAAAEKGLPEDAAKMRVSRARKKLEGLWAVYNQERRGDRANRSHRPASDERPLAPVTRYLLHLQ